MSNLGNKETMAKNIKYYMQKKGLNATDFANTLGFKYTTVLDWLKAKTYPRIDKIEIMADYFGISKSDLVEQQSQEPQKTKGIKIPVLGEVAAGLPISAIEDILDYEEITPEMAKTGEFFGLKIKGRSMEPRILAGDIVIVKQQSDVDSGDIAIVLVNGDSATCKKIQKKDNGIMLIPLNPDYETDFYTIDEILEKPVTIIGKVVELRGKF